MATHSSILAWRIPWTNKPGRLQSMGSERVGHNGVTSLSLFCDSKIFCLLHSQCIEQGLTTKQVLISVC